MTIINPIFSEWKSVGLELTIPMMYHTLVLVTSKALLTLILTGEVICGWSLYSVSSLALAKSLKFFF